MTPASQTAPVTAPWTRRLVSSGVLSSFILVAIFVPFMAIPEENSLRGKILPAHPECYPFSHFPMYSNLKDIWTLKLTNEKDEYVSCQREFRGRPNSVRKLTNARVNELKKERNIDSTKNMTSDDWAEAGRRTLEWLLENHEPMGRIAEAKSLKLWKEEYRLVNQKLEKKKILIVEFPMPKKEVAPSDAAPAPAPVAPVEPPAPPAADPAPQPAAPTTPTSQP